MKQRIEQLDWDQISNKLNDNGYALVSDILTPVACDDLARRYDDRELYRKTINMERYRFGMGEYKYFNYPLPPVIEQIRQSVYPYLAPIANNWMKMLNIHKQFPSIHSEL
ncbi:MAG TPA: 2OG-Fe(II) oxygenase, partial [Mucilaginibacter sp.]|nr:2OG-Fe(II) oxygenase [Mucilaginibacter sp.]